MVKITCCSCRGLRFGSYHPPGLWGHQAYIHVGKPLTHIKIKKKKSTRLLAMANSIFRRNDEVWKSFETMILTTVSGKKHRQRPHDKSLNTGSFK